MPEQQKNKVKAIDAKNNNPSRRAVDPDEDEECFETCIFNCSYAQQQVEDEGEQPNQTGSTSKLQRIGSGNTKLEVLVTDSSSEVGNASMDDKSLLDYDSSNSWDNDK
mmetsp:Transcript_22719/g.27866  ORF Transcript_22719/g.27866 Transcript_22719/m.27866 type:complete len:108 (+) Transcript_22719:219-542(+)